jgi:hypothetical protein
MGRRKNMAMIVTPGDRSAGGKLVAYAVSIGSERTALHIMNADTGNDIEAPIRNVLGFGSVDRSHDERAFFYTRMPAMPPAATRSEGFLNGSVYRHVLGTDSSKDRLAIGPGERR